MIGLSDELPLLPTGAVERKTWGGCPKAAVAARDLWKDDVLQVSAIKNLQSQTGTGRLALSRC
jgi:hypothetical protein